MTEELKPHQIAQLVNKLRDIATKYHAHGCLRELISCEVNAALTQRPAAQAGEREAFEAWFDDYYDKACAEFGGIDCTDPKGIAEDAWQARASLPTQPAAQATPEPVKTMFAASVAARKWAELQDQGHRMQSLQFDGGPGGAGSIDQWGKVMWATPGHAAEIARLKAVIDQLERREILAVAQQATPEPVGEVVAWQRRDRNIVTGEWSEWHEDDDIEEELDPEWAERRPLFTRPAPGVPEGLDDQIMEALRDGLSVCMSVAVSRDRKIRRDGCTLYAQSEEWCRWLDAEVGPKIRAALDALAAAQANGGDK